MTRMKTLLIGLAFCLALFAPLSQAMAEGELNVGLSGNPDTLDPHKTSGTLTFQTIKSFYDTLVEVDRKGNLIPALAEKWVVGDGGLTWTFHLRKGVKFHHGPELTARDVIASLKRIRDKKTASPKAREFSAIKGMSAPEKYTLVLKLSQPYAPLLATLASGWGAVLPADKIESGYNFAASAIGTGPFVFDEWVRDSKVVMKKNKNYWMKGKPVLDKVNLHIITDLSVQAQALMTGQLDLAIITDNAQLELLRKHPEVRIDRGLSSLVLVLAMNNSRKPLDDLRIRQAVNHAVEKQKVLDIAYGGGKVVGTFMDYSDPYYIEESGRYPYDRAKAEALLKKAGYDKGKQLVMALPQNYAKHVKAGELYQEMLRQAGFNVKIRLVDWSTWLKDVYRGANYDFTVIGHTGKLDPHLRLNGYGTPKTYVRWSNRECADLLAKGVKETDLKKRKEIYAKALIIMARETPHLYLGTSFRHVAMRKNVEGFWLTPKLDSLEFRWAGKR